MSPDSTRLVILVNPLAGALGHYSEALASTLEETGAVVRRLELAEPSRSGAGRLAWLLTYARALTTARRAAVEHAAQGVTIIVTWPVLGYLDLLLLGFLARGTDHRLVIHDPRPLVRAVGHSRLAVALASMISIPGRLIVHSEEALEALGSRRFRRHATVVPLPVGPRNIPRVESAGESHPAPVIRVVGQYKPDRDLALMAGLARQADPAWSFEVHGRGWPPVEGWSVSEGFLPSRRLLEVIQSSSVVVIPYRRFYQSDIAVHCLEAGVPFVGPRVSSLRELSSNEAELLIGLDDLHDVDVWLDSIAASLAEPSQRSTPHHARTVRRRGVRSWHRLLAPANSGDPKPTAR